MNRNMCNPRLLGLALVEIDPLRFAETQQSNAIRDEDRDGWAKVITVIKSMSRGSDR